VRPVVLDTSVVLPALLSHRGRRRKLWLLLVYGALAGRVEMARLEAEALQEEARAAGGAVEGRTTEEMVGEAEARLARLGERMPVGAPDDWRLVASGPLLDEYERKLREIGPNLNPDVRADHVPLFRRQIEAVCFDLVDFDPAAIPRYTPDRDDDPIVHTALLADAVFLIADDKHIAPDAEDVFEYTLPQLDRTVMAMRFNRFVEHHLDGFAFDDIDGSWLGLAYHQLGTRD
jgi:predicted nucleic acid-binding protein